MRYFFLNISFIFLWSAAGYAGEYLIKDSDIMIIQADTLEGKSKSFYRYARNEIFARKGYIFKDSELALFFKHQSWYQPVEKTSVELTEIEDKNVSLFKSLEAISKFEFCEILYKYDFNDYPLFYLGYGDENEMRYNRRPYGKFILLDKGYKWLLDCSSVPVEYLQDNKLSEIVLYDQRALKKAQIEFTDIDQGFDNNLGLELKINIFGPSDDREFVFVGFDKYKKFNILFSIPSYVMHQEKINNHKILITATVRKGFLGTCFYPQEYLFDTLDKTLYTVPDLLIESKDSHRYKSRRDLSVYYDARSATNCEKSAIVTTLPKGSMVVFTEFYRAEGSGSAHIKYSENSKIKNGWLNQKDIGPHTFEGLSMAD